MSNLNLEDLELSVNLNGNQLLGILPATIDANSEFVLGIDYGNGVSKQIKGHFYLKINDRYKKRKKGKKYKYFKIKGLLPLSSLEFIGNEEVKNE